MAGATPNTRNWVANELPDFAGRNYHIEVTGQVEVGATNETPVLRMHTPQGINERILMLDLSIVSAGMGGQIMIWKEARFTRPTSGHQYDEADILFDGRIIERIKVEHPKTAKPAAAKKGSKKKVKKPARKAAKKSAKKSAAKKSVKKASKKKAGKRKAGKKKKL
jgi:hypothetical protein